MKISRKYGIVWVALLLVSVLSSACAVQPVKVTESSQPVVVQEIRTSFLRGYDNIGSLTANSEKIAVVRVLDDGICENLDGVICTVNQVEVVRPIYNCEEEEII